MFEKVYPIYGNLYLLTHETPACNLLLLHCFCTVFFSPYWQLLVDAFVCTSLSVSSMHVQFKLRASFPDCMTAAIVTSILHFHLLPPYHYHNGYH